ncbi:MAG: hypothetical protein ACHQHP_03100, partial [Bacteroidia bacterium]
TILPQRTQRIQREPQREIDSAETSAFSAVNNSSVKNILTEKSKPKIAQVVFRNDTLPKKSESDLRKDKKSERKNKKNSPYALLSAFSLLFIIPIIGLIFTCLGFKQIKKRPDKYKGKGFAIAGIIETSFLFFLFIGVGASIYDPIILLWFFISLLALTIGAIIFVFKKKIQPPAKNDQEIQKEKERNKKANNIAIALLFLAIVIGVPFLIAPYISSGILGFLFWAGFIASLIFLIASIRNYHQFKHKPDDNRKLSPKAIAALLWAIINVFCFWGVAIGIFFALTGGSGAIIILTSVLWILTFIIAYQNSIAAKKQIKEGKHWGKFFVIVSRIILWASAILLVYLSLFFGLGAIY